MLEWTQEALLRRFGLPADWVPATPADLEDFESKCVDLLRDPANRSGFLQLARRWSQREAASAISMGHRRA